MYHVGVGLSNQKRSVFDRDWYNAERMDVLDGRINLTLDCSHCRCLQIQGARFKATSVVDISERYFE